jgi:hypothetical protein
VIDLRLETARKVDEAPDFVFMQLTDKEPGICDKFHPDYAKCDKIHLAWERIDRLCGLVVRVPGYRSRDPGFDSRSYQIFF